MGSKSAQTIAWISAPSIFKFILQKQTKFFSINFNKLVNLAVKEFISKPHTIELQPVDEAQWDKMMKKSHKKYKKPLVELAFDDQAKKAFKKHKDAMEKLK